MQVIGVSGSGKTTLIERLVPRLRAEGLRVGTVKHAHHGFEMDRPGKDSGRHLQAGAEAVAVISPERVGWIVRTPEECSIEEATSPMAGRVDGVLVEGFKADGLHPAIRLQPGSGKRLEIRTGNCWVGVPPSALLPEELERVARFCVSVLRGGPVTPAAIRPSMTIKVLCLAQLREQIGESETSVPLPHGATGRDLLQSLESQHPRLAPLLAVSRLALNCEYVSGDVELHAGDEVVLIPPVSGG